MLRISKLTDYGTLVLVHLASRDDGGVCSATDVAIATHLTLPTTQKVLKQLARGGLIISARGADGGYRLAKPAEQITADEILDTLEGPVALTECSDADSTCELESNCQVGGAWQKISTAIRAAMTDITLADLRTPPSEFPLRYTILNESGHAGRALK